MSKTTFVLEVQDLSRQAFEAFKAGAAGAEAQLTELQREVAQASGSFADFQKNIAGAAKYTRDLNFRVESIGKSTADIEAMRAAQLGVTSTAAPMIAKLRELEQVNTAGAMSAKQMSFAMRGVPMQMTDIVTSIASGQQPMMVMLQQGGQLKDMFGGIGPAARAMGGYVAGLVNPLTITAAAVGALGFAWLQGSKESREFQNAAIMSGNAVGMSASHYAMLRDNLSGIAGTKGKAAEVLTEIASSAKLAGANVLSIAETATLMERATGQAVSKTVDQFEELRRSPVEASIKLNEQYNYLTASVYRQIKALEEQGRTVDAANLAEKTYADAMKDRAQKVIDSAGYMEKAWNAVAKAAKGAWDAIADVGRPQTAVEKMAAAAEKVARLQAQLAGVGAFGETGGGAATGGASAARRATLEKELATAQQTLALAAAAAGEENKISQAKAEQSRLTQAAAGWEKIIAENRDKQAKWGLEEKRIRAAGLAAGISELEITKQIAAARERMFSGGQKGGKPAAPFVSTEALDAAKQYAKYFEDFRHAEIAATTATGDLTKSQAKLIEYLSSPAFANATEEMRQIALQQAYAAISAEQLAGAQKDSAKAYAEYQAGMRQSEGQAEKEIIKRVADLEWEAKTYGLLESQVARLTLARLQDAREAAALAGEDVASIERRIAATERLITVLEGKELRAVNKKAADASAKEWDRVADSFVDNLMRGGKNVAQYLKDLFRTLVLQPILAPIGQAMGSVGNAMSTGAASGGSSAIGSMAGSMFGAGGLSGAAMAGAGWMTGATTLTGSLSAATSLMATGSGAGIMSGLGMMAGALGPIAIGIALLVSYFKGRGETRVGGQYEGTSLLASPSGGEIGGDQIRSTIDTTMASINDTLRLLGSGASVGVFQSGLEQSKNGKGFAYARGTLSTGQQFGNWADEGYMQNRGSMTAEEAAAKFGEELKQATIGALQAADVPGILGEWLRSLGDIDALSGGALDAALARIQKALSEKQTLEDRYFELTHSALEVLARDRQRERDALDESNRELYDRIVALQDEAVAVEATRQAHQALTETLTSGLDDAYRALLDARNAESDALKTQISALESSASRFRTFATDIRSFRDSLLLGDLSPLTPAQRYAESRRIAEVTYARALTGDQDAMEQIPQVARDFLEASQVYNASSDAYQRDFATVQTYLTIGAVKADEAASWAQAQTTILSAQLSALGTINASVLTLAQAMAGLREAGAAAIGSGVAIGDDALRAYMTTAIGQGSFMDAYTALQGSGRTMAQGDKLLGYGDGTIADWARYNGLATFAVGTNRVPQDMLAMVHKDEAIVPARYNPAVGGGDNGELVRELQQLRAEVAALRAEHRQGVVSGNETIIEGARLTVQGVTAGGQRQVFERQNAQEAQPR